MKKLLLLALLPVFCFGGQLTWTTAEVEEGMRLAYTPGHLSATFAETNTPAVTTLVSGVSTNVGGVALLDVVHSTDFTYNPTSVYFYYSRAGITDAQFFLNASMSFAYANPGNEIIIRAYKNGTSIDGLFIVRTIGTGGDVGNIYLSGPFTLSTGDYIEIWAECSTGANLTVYSFATDVMEVEAP